MQILHVSRPRPSHGLLSAAEEKERGRIERLRTKGEAVGEFQGFGPPEAYITPHLYEPSPHQNVRIVEQKTNSAGPGGDEWQKVSLEFTAQRWVPFVNTVFIVDACRACMDDFSLGPIGDGRVP